jgi:hypothetical protein
MITTSIDTICRPIGTTNLTREEQKKITITISGWYPKTLEDFLLLDPESITGPVELTGFAHLTSLHLPRVDAVTVSGCAGLTELHAESASYVGALDCPDLAEIHADAAASVYAVACPQIKTITAPQAEISINAARLRRPIATSNVTDPAEHERIMLEVNGVYTNLRQLLASDPESYTTFSTTQAFCSHENGADTLTSLWLPAARSVVIHYGRNLVSVHAPVAESIEIASLGGSLRIVNAPLATEVAIDDERLIWRGGEPVPDGDDSWTDAQASDEVTVLVNAPNRKR